MNDLKYHVIRKAVLQEDEGHEHLWAMFLFKEDANAFIASRDNYFYPGDFYIKEINEDKES